MPEALVPSQDVIDRLLAELRRRLELAVAQKQKVRAHVRAGMQRGSLTEEDGSFDFHLFIDPKC